MILIFLIGFIFCNPSRVLIPSNSSWSLQAWGGANDEIDGYFVVDVDIDEQANMVAPLRSSGHIVMCYFSVGTMEPWRPDVKKNVSLWKSACVGQMQNWDECWLNIANLSLLQTLQSPRFYKAIQMGCHGVELDNIDCYSNPSCWQKIPQFHSSDEAKPFQISFNQWQISLAHSLGLSVAMKNALGLMDDLGSLYDMAVNEQCMQFQECDGYDSFLAMNRLVASVEYEQESCSNVPPNIQTKFCSTGDPDQGICNGGSWSNCFSSQNPLPKIQWTN